MVGSVCGIGVDGMHAQKHTDGVERDSSVHQTARDLVISPG